jgi:hypothetical protein
MASLELVSVDPGMGTVQLRLCLDDATCLECVMPRLMLEQIATVVLQEKVPAIGGVYIDDPRESQPV